MRRTIVLVQLPIPPLGPEPIRGNVPMAAAYLNRYLTRLKAKVVLVESPTLGTIGVGEATIPSLVHFIRLMNLDENEFMRRCAATYKLAIRFDVAGDKKIMDAFVEHA